MMENDEEKEPTRRFAIHIDYRDYTTRFKVVSFPVSLAEEYLIKLESGLVDADQVRGVKIYEISSTIWTHHKTFAEDFSPEHFEKVLGAMSQMIKDEKK
jgi:hypothetical protein